MNRQSEKQDEAVVIIAADVWADFVTWVRGQRLRIEEVHLTEFDLTADAYLVSRIEQGDDPGL